MRHFGDYMPLIALPMRLSPPKLIRQLMQHYLPLQQNVNAGLLWRQVWVGKLRLVYARHLRPLQLLAAVVSVPFMRAGFRAALVRAVPQLAVVQVAKFDEPPKVIWLKRPVPWRARRPFVLPAVMPWVKRVVPSPLVYRVL